MPQPQTFLGTRGETEISGVTYEQLYMIVRRKLDYFHPDKCDPDAFCQDMCCQVEKAQGIYPNVPALRRPPMATPEQIGEATIAVEKLHRSIRRWMNEQGQKGRFVQANQSPDWLKYEEAEKVLAALILHWKDPADGNA